MIVKDIKISSEGGEKQRISCVLNENELWFDLPASTRLRETYADSFLIMALPSSMLRGEPLKVEKHIVSKKLVENLYRVQSILHTWNPKFSRINIEAAQVDPQAELTGTASFFSGGVDSINTLITHRNEIDKTIFISGFDLDADPMELSVISDRNRDILSIFDLQQESVQTNQLEWGRRTGIARNFWHSGYLAATALFFNYRDILIPSTHTYAELYPHGSHPVLDQFWSTGLTTFRHVDADLSRSSKIANIASYPDVLEKLHVCWRRSTYNCGNCGKCLRTMITLAILEKPGPFPRVPSRREFGRIKLKSEEDLSFAIDNILLAERSGKSELVGSLKRAIRRYDRLKALEYIDRGLMYGSLRSLRKRFFPYDMNEGITNGRPDLDI